MEQRYGRLRFLRELPDRSPDKHRVAEWACDCGNVTAVGISRVKNGYTRSCGCLGPELSQQRERVHGMKGTREYASWQAMKRRCLDPNAKDYLRYGAKGITICEEWQSSFEAFYAHVGARPKGTTLDRYPNPSGNYEPGNVRWATPHEQSRNRKDLTVVHTPLGEMALVDYASALGISKGAAHLRLKRGRLEGVTCLNNCKELKHGFVKGPAK